MYCFEAHRCEKFDCPIQQKPAPKCWKKLQSINNRPVTSDDCPWAPCDTCNYFLGWQMGIMNNGMFPVEEYPALETVISKSETEKKPDNQFEKQEITQKPTTKVEKEKDHNPNPDTPKFCYQSVKCYNHKCVVRERQIYKCFNYFSRRNDKREMTCTDRLCENCFYKHGWDIGILTDSMFHEISKKKKQPPATIEPKREASLVEIYLTELANQNLTREEEIELAKRIAGEKHARELFIKANLKLVARIAKKYSSSGISLVELIQEGNIGLMKAVSKFDHNLGYRFSTYASYWIRYYMQKAVANESSSIKIPFHLLATAKKIQSFIRNFHATNHRAPLLSELATELEIDEDKILSILSITETPVSISASKASDDEREDSCIQFYISDKKAVSPEQAALEKLKNEAILNAIKKLPKKQRFIIENYFGFNTEQLSLAEIGRRLNLSRERVRQILKDALYLLRQDSFINAQKG